MPALRLKTKLVIAITGMVVAIVATLATLYISEVVHQRVREVYLVAQVLRDQIFSVSKPTFDVDLSGTKIDMNDPKQVENAIQDLLQSDSSMSALLDSVSSEPNILDAAIVDANGLALLHTNPALQGTVVQPRPDYSQLLNASFREQLKVIYGTQQT